LREERRGGKGKGFTLVYSTLRGQMAGKTPPGCPNPCKGPGPKEKREAKGKKRTQLKLKGHKKKNVKKKKNERGKG